MSDPSPSDVPVNPSDPPTETPTEPPAKAADSATWETIKDYFLPADVKCMKKMGIDLSKKESVQGRADAIYGKTSTGKMPKQMKPFTQENPDPLHPLWTKAMCDNFKAWMDAGFP